MHKAFAYPLTIANGQSLSGEVPTAEGLYFAVQMPAAFTGVKLSFQGAFESGGTFQDIYDDAGTEVQAVCAAGHTVSLDVISAKLRMYPFLKVRSGLTGAPTAEAAARTLYLIRQA